MFTNTRVGRCSDRSGKEGVCNGGTVPSLSRISPFSAMPRGALQLVYSSVVCTPISLCVCLCPPFVCMSVCTPISLCVCLCLSFLSVFLFVRLFLFVSVSVSLFVCMSVCTPISLCVCLCLSFLSVCLSVRLLLFVYVSVSLFCL